MTVYINSTTNAETITTFTLISGIVTIIITSSIITAITMTGMFLYCQRSIKNKVKSATPETAPPMNCDEVKAQGFNISVSDNPAYGPMYN